jgi:cobalt-zinc-cadmium resistance protein CzcA
MARDAQVKGVEDLGIFHVLGQPNLNIKVDREKAARYGLNTGDVNTVIQAAWAGAVATTVLEGDRQFNLTVRLRSQVPQQHRGHRQRQGGLSDAERRNAYIPLRELATISLDTGASYIYHERTQRFIPSSSAFAAATSAAPSPRRRSGSPRISSCRRGYRIVWAGEFEDLQTGQAAPGDRSCR